MFIYIGCDFDLEYKLIIWSFVALFNYSKTQFHKL